MTTAQTDPTPSPPGDTEFRFMLLATMAAKGHSQRYLARWINQKMIERGYDIHADPNDHLTTSQATISKWQKGKGVPLPPKRPVLAEYMGISLAAVERACGDPENSGDVGVLREQMLDAQAQLLAERTKSSELERALYASDDRFVRLDRDRHRLQQRLAEAEAVVKDLREKVSRLTADTPTPASTRAAAAKKTAGKGRARHVAAVR